MPTKPPARHGDWIAMVVLLLWGCDKQPARAPQPAPTPKGSVKDKAATPVRISAKELSQFSVSDFHGTFEKYKDTPLEVEGVVGFATPYLDTGPAVSLIGVKTVTGTLRHNRDIWCEFTPNQAKQVVIMAPGQQALIRGKLAGTLNKTILSECEFTTIGAPTAIEVTAERLVAEYRSNPAATRSKYHEKWVFVTGTISELEKNAADRRHLRIVLAGNPAKLEKSGNIEVEPYLHDKDEWTAARVKELKVGSKARVAGRIVLFDDGNHRMNVFSGVHLLD